MIDILFLLTRHIELQFNNKNKDDDDRDMMVISWPYDAIHKTHIHFDKATGEMTLGKAPDWEICKSLCRKAHKTINKLTLRLFGSSAGLGCKQQDLLLSSFIKRIYAEIAQNHPPTPPPKNESRKNPPPSEPQQEQQETPIPTVERKRQPAAKKTMSTVEALAELEKLCKLEDPHKVYTNMVKIGEG